MKQIFIALAVSGVIGLLPLQAMAEETGLNRMGKGTVDAVTSPGQVVEGISDQAEEHGPVVGTVSGSVVGGAKAAGQAAKGGANVGVGAVETILSPLTGD